MNINPRMCCFCLLLGLAAGMACSKTHELTCPDPVPVRPLDIQPDETFPIGPYLMHTTETQTSLMWTTAQDCAGEVAFGSGPENLDQVQSSQVDGLVHRANLTGLKPDTRYAYQVSACGLSSGIHHFHTAPPLGMPVRFTVWGDSRTDIAQCRKTVQAMAENRPHFNLHTGDVVTDGTIDQQWTDEFFDPLRPLGHEVPTYVAIGNHEKNAPLFYKLVDYPIPAQLSDRAMFGSNYSFTYGNTFFLILDANSPMFLFADQVDSDLSDWIRAQMASPEAQQATWRFASTHEPGYSEGWSPGGCDKYEGNFTVRNWLFPLLIEHDFHVYFAGHTHDYERGEVDGLVHIIAGGGGSSLDEWCRDFPEVEKVELDYHFVEVEAGCDELTINAIRIPADAEPFDTVVIKRTSP